LYGRQHKSAGRLRGRICKPILANQSSVISHTNGGQQCVPLDCDSSRVGANRGGGKLLVVEVNLNLRCKYLGTVSGVRDRRNGMIAESVSPTLELNLVTARVPNGAAGPQERDAFCRHQAGVTCYSKFDREPGARFHRE